MQWFLKINGGMANSVDPDQTASSGAVISGSALFVYAILSATLVYEILDIYSIDIFLLLHKKNNKQTKKNTVAGIHQH